MRRRAFLSTLVGVRGVRGVLLIQQSVSRGTPPSCTPPWVRGRAIASLLLGSRLEAPQGSCYSLA